MAALSNPGSVLKRVLEQKSETEYHLDLNSLEISPVKNDVTTVNSSWFITRDDKTTPVDPLLASVLDSLLAASEEKREQEYREGLAVQEENDNLGNPF